MRSTKIIVGATLLFCAWVPVVLAIFSNKISIRNRAEKPIFVSFYYERDFPKFETRRVTEPRQIPVMEKTNFELPDFKFSWDRKAVISTDPSFLKASLTHREYVNLAHFDVGITSGDEFVVKRDSDNRLRGYGVLARAVAPITKLFTSDKKKIQEVGESHAISVRTGTEIAPQETSFVQKRLPIVKKALEKVIGALPGDTVPVIALQGSGGGYRAFIGFLGAIQGLQEIGLWDACTHAAGVSGSTWLLSGLYGYRKSIDEFRAYITNRFTEDLRAKDIYNNKEFRRIFDQKDDFTLVDLWGLMLSNQFFGEGPSIGETVTLSGLISCIDQGQMPLYISTAVQRGLSEHKWFEYTPYEVGSADLGAFIPARYAGAKFINGVCQEPNFKEYPLGLHCGVFGSAFAVDMQRISQALNMSFFNLLVAKTNFGGYQLTTGSLVNFMRGMDTMIMSRSTNIKVCDSGESLNIPMPSCLRRKPHLMIIVNVYQNPDAHIMQAAFDDAKKRGYKMPPIPAEGIDNRAISVLQDLDDPTVPVVIHIPNLYYDFETTKFAYKKKEFDALCNAMKKAVVDNKEVLYAACKNVAAVANGSTVITPVASSPMIPVLNLIKDDNKKATDTKQKKPIKEQPVAEPQHVPQQPQAPVQPTHTATPVSPEFIKVRNPTKKVLTRQAVDPSMLHEEYSDAGQEGQ